MNQRLCYCFDDLEKCQKMVEENKTNVLLSTNKFRVCFFIQDENTQSFENLNRDSLVVVHEVLTHSFTYLNSLSPQRIDQVLALDTKNKMWIGDIDIWIDLPIKYAEIIKRFSNHTFFHAHDELFKNIQSKHVVAN